MFNGTISLRVMVYLSFSANEAIVVSLKCLDEHIHCLNSSLNRTVILSERVSPRALNGLIVSYIFFDSLAIFYVFAGV